MSNTQIQSMDITPPTKQPNYLSGSVSIGEMLKALTTVMIQESLLIVTFSKIMDQLNEKMLNYTNDYAGENIQVAKSTKITGIISEMSNFMMIIPILMTFSMLKFEFPENPNAGKVQKKINEITNGSFGLAPYFSPAIIAFLNSFQTKYTLNKGKLTSESMKIKTGTEKCKGLIDFLKQHFNSDSSTLNQITTMIKDIIERDYNSKAKKLYFYNKK